MKLYTMRCIKDPERMDECFEPDNQEEQYFVKLETQEEADCYRWCWVERSSDMLKTQYAYRDGYWDCYMTECLGTDMEDEQVYGYMMDNEPSLQIEERYTDSEGSVWERIE